MQLSAADDVPDDDIRRRRRPRESTHIPPALCPDRGVATTVPACLGAPGRYRRDHNISDFLAKSVVTGFIFGLAITVAASQIPKLLGLPRVGQATPEQIWYLLRHLDQTNLWTLAIGIGALALTALMGRYAHRVSAARLQRRRQPTYERIDTRGAAATGRAAQVFNTSTASTRIRTATAARFGAVYSVVLNIGASADLDIASLDMLHDLADELRAARVELLLAQVKGSTYDRLRRSGVIGLIGRTHIYHSVSEAVAAALQVHQPEVVLSIRPSAAWT